MMIPCRRGLHMVSSSRLYSCCPRCSDASLTANAILQVNHGLRSRLAVFSPYALDYRLEVLDDLICKFCNVGDHIRV